MNYYLTPTVIAEALHLTDLRKSTPEGMYLLSESDLVSYGIERAKNEGAIELSNNRRTSPAQEVATGEETVTENGNTPSEGDNNDSEEESHSEEETESEEETVTSEENENEENVTGDSPETNENNVNEEEE